MVLTIVDALGERIADLIFINCMVNPAVKANDFFQRPALAQVLKFVTVITPSDRGDV